MMNDDLHYEPEMPDKEYDERLDRYFGQVELPEVDTTGITVITRMKVLQDRLARSRHRWRLVSLSAIAACLAVVCTVGVRVLWHGSHAASDTTYAGVDMAGYSYNEMTVPTGQRMTIVLPDGTKLIANSRSQVRYPTRFVGDTRNVWASGEVYFEVARDERKPFVVNMDGFNVRVYGTTFSISNYNPDEASVVLLEGSVAVTTDGDERVKMRPGHRLTIREGAIDEMTNVKTSLYTSWTQGGMILENLTLGEIAPRLSAYYDVGIEVDPGIYNSRLYGCLDLKGDIMEVLSVLSSIIPMDVEELGDGNSFRLKPINQSIY
ncbi:MAG: FecR domain-containing protein [Muribaculaceae bacterium]|nr:FecR domain-containing protein [Muribaculaceae bacterium]